MRYRNSLVAAGLILAAAAGTSWRRPVPVQASSGGQATGSPAQGSTAVRQAPVGQRFPASPGQKGATYYALESQAVRSTTRFADAVAVTERAFDGDLHVTLRNGEGNEVARFKVDRVEGSTDVLQFAPQDGRPVFAYSEASVKPTLDWSAQQAYQLWKDGVSSDADRLEWRGSFIRRKGAPNRDAERAVLELQTDWATGLVSKTARRTAARLSLLPGRTLNGDVLATTLSQSGTELGVVNWFAESKILAWNIAGLSKGYLAPEHLADYGGAWPFIPDMAWMNLQAMAFHHFKTQIDRNGFVARARPWTDRIADWIAPTLHANEAGCDGLHWLDGSILRYCCDVHDLCYEKGGCSARSWWRVWSSWTCDFCNAWVVVCFLDGGIDWNQWGMVK
jgi:hypothetical protein